jgi:hypothetical protein
MSTQRRASHSTPSTKTYRQGPRNGLRPTGCMEGERSLELSNSGLLVSALLVSAFSAQIDHADSSGGTAPRGLRRKLTSTESLQSDYRNTRLVRLVSLNIRPGSPPTRAGHRAAAVTLKSFGFSFPHIPSSSCLARFHLSLPRVLAALRRRSERYDGKRDMYFQHAA